MTDTHHLLRADGGEPWKDEELMNQLREEGLSYREMGERLGCSQSTISAWMKRHRADEIREDLDVEIPDGKPYQDRELMDTLYNEYDLSTTDIAVVLDCSTGGVNEWMDRLGIEKRSRSDAASLWRDDGDIPSFYTIESRGYEAINTSTENAYVHRLQAVAYWGFDEVADKQVHHKDGIEWHNTEYNLELLTPREHISREHGGNIWLDRLRAAEMYREGASSYDVAPRLEVSPGTVLEWVREVDPGLVRTHGGASA